MFKVGDKVRLLSNGGYGGDCAKGDVLTILRPGNTGAYLNVKGFENGLYFYDYEFEPVEEENLKLYEEKVKAPITSDGGSSSYYDKEIPQWLLKRLIERNDEGKCFIKTEELIEVLFRNDFSFGNAFKALVRADGVVTGQGKAGNTLSYETTKVKYYANRILEQGENK